MRNTRAHVLRDGESIFSGQLASLKRFQEDAAEVRMGYECGIAIQGFSGFEEGDIIEAYREERVG
jgi:translation initiation factor IF-2